MHPILPAEALIQLDTSADAVRLVATVLALAALSALLRRVAGLGNGRDEVVAIVRATLQLGAVGLIIAAVLGSWPLTLLFVGVMVGVAAWTSAGRMGIHRRGVPLLPVALGGLPPTLVVLAVGLLPAQPCLLYTSRCV